jgi:tetratricopeptide (TPR) repeat protein
VDQHGSGEPYLPVLEALSQLCRIDSTLLSLLRAVAPTWLLQLPWFSTPAEREELRRELAGVSPDRMLREIAELLDRCGERRPLLLVTEDLHWGDRATIQLIDYVARRRSAAPLMWLASFRLAEVVALDHPLGPVRRELRLHRLCDEIVLDSFSEREVAEYVAQRMPASAGDEAFVRALHARTDGLPLFVASVMDEMSARTGDRGDGAAAAEQLSKIAVPENLAAIIERYIARLDDEPRVLLTAAAVCGVQFRVDTIANALQRDAALVAEACEKLARQDLWLTAARTDDGADATELTYSFRHALFRQVLYDGIAPAARTRLHRQVGGALERERSARVPVSAAELAMHFERAREVVTAVRYYAEAAEAALADFKPEGCMTFTERASALLAHAPDGAERTAWAITVATLRGLAATRVLGVGSEAKSAFERAYSLLDEVPDHPMRGHLLHGYGFMLSLRAEYGEALAVADRAEALGSTSNDPVLLSTACTVHGLVDQLQGRSPDARRWLERGLALAEEIDVGPGEYLVDPQVALLGLLANPLLHAGLVHQARACLQRAYDRARERAWPMARLVAIWHASMFEVRLGNAERVAALADEMRALVDDAALAHGRTACRWFRGWADAKLGSPREGYQRIRAAYEENVRLGMHVGASETLGYATEALIHAGDFDGAREQLDEALHVADTLGERVYLPQLLLMEAAIAGARGQAAAAAKRRGARSRRPGRRTPLAGAPGADGSLCRRGRHRRGRVALAALVDRLPEANDTRLVAKARQLIDRPNTP